MDFTALRQLFPVTRQAVYLNNAAESPLNTRVRARLDEYLDLAVNAPQDKPGVRHPVRTALSRLLGGAPDEYALVTSTGVGVGLAAAGYAWQPGDNVVLPADEHWNSLFPWLALRERGVEVRLVPVDEDQRVPLEAVAARVDGRTRMLATTAVRFNTGFRADLPAWSQLAHAHGALLLVDGIQAAGVVPFNIEDEGIDICTCAGFKWLLGLPGTGFLYVKREVQEKIRPVLPGMYAADNRNLKAVDYLPDARRYETGTMAYAFFHAWPAGLEILQEAGIANIHMRVMALTDRIIAGLRAKNIPIASPVDKISERSAILAFSAGSEADNQALYERLTAQKILVALRDGRIRVSPNFFNTEEEIDTFLDAL